MRNAFLNAPWIKGIIPISEDKEIAAINWLSQIEGSTGFTENYGGIANGVVFFNSFPVRL